ncbi:uncharacterized protein LOC125483037 isoform X2 [Rhincodon typus]|nr:uncharacterized protein LOC125483037 isoform X2 [Rhincodon typus]
MPTPHMFTPPVSHFMHPPAFHPYFYPTVDIGGGLYYPVCPMPYPRGFGPQSPITHTNYRRPFLNSSLVARPTFYHSTRFRHYPFRKNVTNTEVQTDSETNLEQTKRTAMIAETLASNSPAPEARVQKSSGIETNSDSTPVPAQERVSHKGIRGELNETEEVSAALAPKNTKPGGFAFQKEKIRIQCSEGAPSINVWRSFEATVPIYNPTPNKGEDGIQCEMWSVSACEGGVPFYGSFDPDKTIQKKEVRKEYSIATSGEIMLDSSKSPRNGPESQAVGDEVPHCVATLDKLEPTPCITDGSHKCSTNTYQHDVPEKPSHQRSPRGVLDKNGTGEKDETKNSEQLISPGSPNDEKMGEGSKSDGSLESVEEYVPSASVLAWLQDQARSYRRKASLPPIPSHRPGVFQGSFEEMSSKDEESSFDFFDAMPVRNKVSYTHLMCNPRPPPVRQMLSASEARSGSKTLETPLAPEKEKRFCSACQKETLMKAKGDNAGCGTHSANRDLGSDALSERDHFSQDQSIGGSSVTGGRRKYRRVSRESSSSNKNKKTRYSSDSEQASEDQDNESRAENVKLGGFSRRKIVRRPSKVSTTPLSSRSQPEKPRGKKKALDASKYPINPREQIKTGNEHNERQNLGQTAKPERKRKEEKRRKSTRKAMSVQNGSEESVDEYWNKVGAKPKSATSSQGDAEHETLQQNFKALCKPVPLKKGTREFNEMETWDSSCLHGFRGNSLRRRTRKKC